MITRFPKMRHATDDVDRLLTTGEDLLYSPIRMNIAMTPEPRRSLDDTLVALADPTRRAILEQLSRGDARVTDVALPFPISLNSVSKHIRLLERAGLVRRHVVGREHHLSLDTRPLEDAANWIERQRMLWQSRLRMLDSLLREEDRARRPQHKATQPKTKKRGL